MVNFKIGIAVFRLARSINEIKVLKVLKTQSFFWKEYIYTYIFLKLSTTGVKWKVCYDMQMNWWCA